MSMEIFLNEIASHFEADQQEGVKEIVKQALASSKFLEAAPQVATRHQTGYQLFVHENKNCEEVIALKAGPLRFKKLGAMWQALKDVPVEGQAYWNEKAKTTSVSAPAKKASKVPKDPKAPVVRRQTGYQLFVHETKNNPEVLACTPGPERFKKNGAMWQALKDVPVEGQTYWNEKAKAL